MNIKTKAVKLKDTVVKHRAKIAVAVTFIVMAKLNLSTQAEQLDFIASKGLLQEYFTPDANL